MAGGGRRMTGGRRWMAGRGEGRAGEGRGERAAGKESACGEKDAEGRGNRKTDPGPLRGLVSGICAAGIRRE